MVDSLHVYTVGWTQVLEETSTSLATDHEGRKIELKYPVNSVTGVWDNDAGTGTNYWSPYATGHPNLKRREIHMEGKWIALPLASGLAANTACWVTYVVPSAVRPLYGGYGASGLTGLAKPCSNGLEYNFTGFTEMTGPITGTPVEVGIEPATGGLFVNSVKVVTDGTNINLYIFKDSTASYANMIYRLNGINTFTIDNSQWVIPLDNTSVWVGYQDVGANATPANTTVEIRGQPLI